MYLSPPSGGKTTFSGRRPTLAGNTRPRGCPFSLPRTVPRVEVGPHYPVGTGAKLRMRLRTAMESRARRVALGEAHDEPPRMPQDASRDTDETKAQSRFRRLCAQPSGSTRCLNQGVAVEGEHHDGPPGGVDPEQPRGHLPAGQVGLHHPMGRFALATTLPVRVESPPRPASYDSSPPQTPYSGSLQTA